MYEFNEDAPNWKVEWARNLQERHMLTNYYTITELSIPIQKWLTYIELH